MSFLKKFFKSEPPLLAEGEEPSGPLPQRVLMKTSLGDIELELYTEQTPKVSCSPPPIHLPTRITPFPNIFIDLLQLYHAL